MAGRRTIRVAGTVVLLVASWAPAGLARNVNYAFLVGVSEYRRGELKPLQYPRNDIIDFADELQKTGFRRENIVLMHEGQRDPSRLPEARKIRQELSLLLGSVEEGDTLVVALAGHGVQFLGDKSSYFCPVDAVLEDRTTLIQLEDLYRELDECPASRKLLLVDACRNDPQSPLARSRERIKLESVTRPQVDALPRGIAAIFSCKPGQQSFEDDKLKHGVFFNFVLQGWRGAADGVEGVGQPADGNVTLEEFTEYVKEQTKIYTRQNLKKIQNPISRNESDDTHPWILCSHGSQRTSVQSLLQRAQELREQQRYEQAIEEYTKVIRADSSFVEAYVRRGQCYGGLNDSQSAFGDFREALRRQPENVTALISRAALYGRSGEFENAIKDYNLAIKLKGDREDAYAGRGAAFAASRRFPDALRDLNTSIELGKKNSQKNVDAYSNRAFVRRQMGDARGASADLKEVERLKAAPGRP